MTPRIGVIAAVPVVLATLASCQTVRLVKAMDLTAGAFRASAQLVRYEHKRVAGVEMTFVYGNLSIKNVGPVAKTLDMNALRLSFGESLSSGAEVDSVAYFLPSILVEPEAAVRRDVYWAFDGHLAPAKWDGVRLLYVQGLTREESTTRSETPAPRPRPKGTFDGK